MRVDVMAPIHEIRLKNSFVNPRIKPIRMDTKTIPTTEISKTFTKHFLEKPIFSFYIIKE
jgi:hypothetical protein